MSDLIKFFLAIMLLSLIALLCTTFLHRLEEMTTRGIKPVLTEIWEGPGNAGQGGPPVQP